MDWRRGEVLEHGTVRAVSRVLGSALALDPPAFSTAAHLASGDRHRFAHPCQIVTTPCPLSLTMEI
eukprot:m.485519 g.485519  ORF g.485519 m.485519 type:complete len:66 (+) comp74707_c0_seq1:288-485(+)